MKTSSCFLLLIATIARLPAFAQTPKLNSYATAKATVFIDFDGQFVSGTAWNYNGDINATASGLSDASITEIMNRVGEDYRPFDLNITTDSTVYWSAPRNKRMRVIVTPSSQWYGSSAAGVAYVGSFIWGDNTPAWVFSALLGNQPKWVAEAVSHEVGHTLGLQHQSSYDANCNKTAEYNTGLGTGEIGWAPIMGAGYYQNHTTWHIGPNTINCSNLQNDFDIISTKNGFGLRADDHGDNNATATDINVFADAFSASGLINTASDLDVFKLNLTHPTTLQLSAIPQNVGSGDDGANVDIKVTLLYGNDTINSYNPLTLLNAGVDTNLNAGTYYLVVDGVGNIYHDDVGSIGLYNLVGSLATLLPVKDLHFSGTINNNKHHLSWSFQWNENLKQSIIETSPDGQHFSVLASLNPAVKTYSYQPTGNAPLYYRLKIMTAGNGQTYTSDIIRLSGSISAPRIQVIHTGDDKITVSSKEKFIYQLFTTGGQLVSSGKLIAGSNQVRTAGAKGLLILHCSNENLSFSEKIIKQ
ncbi:MAG: hypothetical protein ABI813_12635 [Bacteroidota bacterium]